MTDHTTDPLRDRIRRAICEAEGFGFAWGTDMLEPDEYGEVADAVLAVLPTADPVCICGHPEERHFEDVCQTCGCGDYLEPRDAADVIARWRQAALKAPADRAAVLREAADALGRMDYDTDSNDYGYDTYRDAWNGGVMDGAALLRRMADEAQPPSPRCTCGETACESDLCDCDSAPCPVDHADEAQPATQANDDYERTTGHLITCLAVAGGIPDPDCPCTRKAQPAGPATDDEARP